MQSLKKAIYTMQRFLFDDDLRAFEQLFKSVCGVVFFRTRFSDVHITSFQKLNQFPFRKLLLENNQCYVFVVGTVLILFIVA